MNFLQSRQRGGRFIATRQLHNKDKGQQRLTVDLCSMTTKEVALLSYSRTILPQDRSKSNHLFCVPHNNPIYGGGL